MFRRLSTATIGASSIRFCGDQKKKKIDEEDERWLEAQFSDKVHTPEEKYAFQKQRDLMKGLMGKMREEQHVQVQNVKKELEVKHEENVDDLKKKIDELNKKLDAAGKK